MQAMQCRTLVELDVSQNSQLTFEDATYLHLLVVLEILNVYKCNVTMYGFRHLAKLFCLKELTISFNGYETDGRHSDFQDLGMGCSVQECKILDVCERHLDYSV